MFGENADVGRGEDVGWDLLGSPREWAPLGKSLSDSSPPPPPFFQFRAPLRSSRGDRIACGAGELPIFALGAPGYRVSCRFQHSPTMMSPVPAMFPLYISMPFDLQ